MSSIPISWRRAVARVVKIPFVNYLMAWGIRLVVPRQRIGVTLVAQDEEGRVLLLHHVFHPSMPWGLPGGWLNRHEDPAKGIVRELKEETGLTAVPHAILHIQKNNSPAHLDIYYLGHVQPGPITLSAEILEAAWFPIDNLPDSLSPVTRKVIEAAVLKQGTS